MPTVVSHTRRLPLSSWRLSRYALSRSALVAGSGVISGVVRTEEGVPLAAVAMLIFMLSLGGIPPTAGFMGKFWLFGAAIESGYVWLAVIGVLNSAISLYYDARVIKAMFAEMADRVPVPAALHLDHCPDRAVIEECVRKILAAIGEDYIAKAFEYAHAADPDAELYYNDYNLWKPAKLKGAVQLVTRLRAQGLRVDAVGERAGDPAAIARDALGRATAAA